MELVKNMLSGDRVALAKLMSILEREPDEIPSIMEQIHSKTAVSYTHLTLPTNREV